MFSSRFVCCSTSLARGKPFVCFNGVVFERYLFLCSVLNEKCSDRQRAADHAIARTGTPVGQRSDRGNNSFRNSRDVRFSNAGKTFLAGFPGMRFAQGSVAFAGRWTSWLITSWLRCVDPKDIELESSWLPFGAYCPG